MVKVILSDFSRVLLLPLDESYSGGLNALHRELLKNGDYDFWKHFKINTELLSLYQEYQKQIEVAIFTEGHIQDYPSVKEKIAGIFKNVFSAADLGFKKDDPQIYGIVSERLGYSPHEIFYIDDRRENVDAATRAGMNACAYTTNEETIQKIQEVTMHI